MQEIPEDGTLRTLSRGLQVLELLEQVENMGFLELHRSTGLPKASLSRILQTLVRAGWVSQRLADQRYRINRGRTALDGWEQARAVVAESATVHLDQLRREVLWPSDISICDGTKMVILESNRSVSPLTINRNVMGLHPRMLWSAVGRAYLAACPAGERKRILANLAASSHPEDAAFGDRPWVQAMLKQTLAHGYGLRAEGYESPDQHAPGQLNAMAVPVLSKGRVIACLSLVWLRAVADEAQVVRAQLPRLRLAAERIGADLLKLGVVRPMWLGHVEGDPLHSVNRP